MSSFGTHGITKALNSAALVHVNQYMAHEDSENLKKLRASIEADLPENSL